MTTKEKIALHALMQKVKRGMLTEEQAKAEFTQITGRDPEEEPSKDDDEGQRLGEFLSALNTALAAVALAKEEAENQPQPTTFDLNPPTDKMLAKRGKTKASPLK